MVGNVLHGRQTFCRQIIAVEIVGKQCFEAVENLVIGYFSGDELPLVKTLGIAQQSFNLRNDNVLAELIDVGMVFLLDVADDVVLMVNIFVGKLILKLHQCTEKIYIFVVIKFKLHETQFFLPVHPDFSMGFLTS